MAETAQMAQRYSTVILAVRKLDNSINKIKESLKMNDALVHAEVEPA